MDFETSGDLIHCGSWSHDGSLLACEKKGRGVDVYLPFRNCEKQEAIHQEQSQLCGRFVYAQEQKLGGSDVMKQEQFGSLDHDRSFFH